MFPSISQSIFIRFSVCSSIPNMFPIMSSSCVTPHLIPLISNSNLVIRTLKPDGQSNSVSPPIQNFHVRPTKRTDLREASFGRLHSCFTICNFSQVFFILFSSEGNDRLFQNSTILNFIFSS